MIIPKSPCEGCPKYRKDYHLGYPEGNYHRDCLISECVRRERFEATIKAQAEAWWDAVDWLDNMADQCLNSTFRQHFEHCYYELKSYVIEQGIERPNGQTTTT